MCGYIQGVWWSRTCLWDLRDDSIHGYRERRVDDDIGYIRESLQDLIEELGGLYPYNSKHKVNADYDAIILSHQWGNVVECSYLLWVEGAPVIGIWNAQIGHAEQPLGQVCFPDFFGG